MRSPLPHFSLLSLAALFVASAATAPMAAQEPSASLRQADAEYREGVAAMGRNDLSAAQARFEAVVRLAPTAEQGHSALGAVLVREGQNAAGMRELEKALAIKPGDESAQLNLAIVYEQTGAFAKSLPLFARAETSARAANHVLPASVLSAYARSLAATGDQPAALTHMRDAVEQDGHNAELRDGLGTLYAQRQDWPHAEEELEEALRLKPDLAMAHLHLGSALAAEHKPGAGDEWMHAVKLAPQSEDVALAVGKALADSGQDKQAISVLQRAVDLAPHSSAAGYQLALVLQRENRFKDAIPLLKKVVAAEPRNEEALTNLGLALTQAHQAQDALSYLKKATELRPANATAHQDLAAAYLQINQVDDAIVQLEAALRLDPNEPQLHYNLGVAYKLKDDPARAIPELETAEKLNPRGYEAPYVLGLLYDQQGKYVEAAAKLDLALKLHPQNGEGWSTLGSVYNQLGRLPEAAVALREAARQLPDKPDPHLLLATVLMKQNHVAEAAEERKVAAGLMRTHMNFQRAEVATNSGKAAVAGGDMNGAVAQFRQAITFDPQYAEAHRELANVLEKQGKTAEAAAERALAQDPAPPVQ